MKQSVLWGIMIGSTIGGVVPALWGDSLLSYGAVIWSGIGGVAGAVIGIYVGKWMSGG